MIPGYYNSRLLHHLTFVRGSEYMSGLTVYYSTSGIQGMRAHFFSDSITLGQDAGYPLHLALAPGEYLASAWVNQLAHEMLRIELSEFVFSVINP